MLGIRFYRLEGGVGGPYDSAPPGAWLSSYDPNAYDGRGSATWTLNVEHALKFKSAAEALAFYRQRSTVKPKREDGKDNRPLTAFTVEVSDLPS